MRELTLVERWKKDMMAYIIEQRKQCVAKGIDPRITITSVVEIKHDKPRPLPTIEFPWPERDDGGSK